MPPAAGGKQAPPVEGPNAVPRLVSSGLGTSPRPCRLLSPLRGHSSPRGCGAAKSTLPAGSESLSRVMPAEPADSARLLRGVDSVRETGARAVGDGDEAVECTPPLLCRCRNIATAEALPPAALPIPLTERSLSKSTMRKVPACVPPLGLQPVLLLEHAGAADSPSEPSAQHQCILASRKPGKVTRSISFLCSAMC